MFEIGRLCVKTSGREAGRYCVIVKKVDENFMMVTGPKALTKVRRRKCNVAHLEPILEKLSIKDDASDIEVLDAFEKAKLFEKLKVKKISKSELKELEAKRAEKDKAKKERAAKEAKPEPKKEAPKEAPKPEKK